MKQKRIYYLDILRSLACLCVIMIHVSEYSISKGYTPFSFTLSGILDAFSRIGIPLFFMISGALLLDENKKYDFAKLKKNIFNILIIFFSWSLIYCISLDYVLPLVSNVPITPLNDVVKHFILGQDILWFLKAIIGLYLFVPILKLWVKKDNKKYVQYFLIISIILTIILPTIAFIGSKYWPFLKNINSNLYLINNSTKFLTYFVLGWYLHNYSLKHKVIIYILGIISLLCSICLYIVLSRKTINYLDIFDFSSFFIFIQSIATYIFFKERKYKKEKKITTMLSKYSLGIYVSHILGVLFLLKLEKFIPYISNYYILRVIYIYCGTLIMSFISTFIISKIPYIKKIVNQ